MEEIMRVPTITELMRLTRTELCGLLVRVTTQLQTLPESSPERGDAMIAIRNIRWVLARRDLSP
jgi:hypothetical protein